MHKSVLVENENGQSIELKKNLVKGSIQWCPINLLLNLESDEK